MTTTRTRWLAAAAALIASLLSTAAPALAQTSATPAEEFVDQWAVGKDWSARVDTNPQPETFVDQWAVGKDWTATPVAGAEPSNVAGSLTSTQLQLIVAGLLIAAALGITTAAAISRHRHTFSAH